MRTTIVRAYAVEGNTANRTLAASDGRVFVGGDWVTPAAAVKVIHLPGEFSRWQDVPAAWLGTLPWWK